MDEFALLRAWREGDASAGQRLLRIHVDTLYHFFVTKTDAHTAEELTQATFETCLQKRDRLDVSSSLRAYLLGIARNKLLQHRDAWRRRGSKQVPLQSSVEAPVTSPSVMVARNEQQNLVLRALQQLPLDLQIAIELHYWEELSLPEIAEVLDIPTGTVKSRLFRARAALRECVEQVPASPQARQATLHGLESWIASLRDRVGSSPEDAT